MDCFIRAFNAGLRYSGFLGVGITDLPKPTPESVVWRLIDSFGLYRVRLEQVRKNEPVLVCYIHEDLNKEQIGHAVFCSDIQPFHGFVIPTIISGWNVVRRGWKFFDGKFSWWDKAGNFRYPVVMMRDGLIGALDELVDSGYDANDIRYIKR